MSSPTFVICVLFDDSHSDRCEVIFHWGLHFPDISNVEQSSVFSHITLMLLSLLICKMITTLGPTSVSSWAWKEIVHEEYLAHVWHLRNKRQVLQSQKRNSNSFGVKHLGFQPWFWHWITTWPWQLPLTSLGTGASQVVLAVKKLPANAGDGRDVGSTPGSGRSPGGGHGNPLQYSRLKNPMDRGAWLSYNPWDHQESDSCVTCEHSLILR